MACLLAETADILGFSSTSISRIYSMVWNGSYVVKNALSMSEEIDQIGSSC